MSALFIYIYIYFFFLSGLGPETYVALLINIHFFYIVCVLIVVSLLFSMIYMARIEDQSETSSLNLVAVALWINLYELA